VGRLGEDYRRAPESRSKPQCRPERGWPGLRGPRGDLTATGSGQSAFEKFDRSAAASGAQAAAKTARSRCAGAVRSGPQSAHRACKDPGGSFRFDWRPTFPAAPARRRSSKKDVTKLEKLGVQNHGLFAPAPVRPWWARWKAGSLDEIHLQAFGTGAAQAVEQKRPARRFFAHAWPPEEGVGRGRSAGVLGGRSPAGTFRRFGSPVPLPAGPWSGAEAGKGQPKRAEKPHPPGGSALGQRRPGEKKPFHPAAKTGPALFMVLGRGLGRRRPSLGGNG